MGQYITQLHVDAMSETNPPMSRTNIGAHTAPTAVADKTVRLDVLSFIQYQVIPPLHFPWILTRSNEDCCANDLSSGKGRRSCSTTVYLSELDMRGLISRLVYNSLLTYANLKEPSHEATQT